MVLIYAHGKVIGKIGIDSRDPAAFTDQDKNLLEEIAQIIGTYIEGDDKTLTTKSSPNPSPLQS